MSQHNNQIESRLWSAADELRANSKLKSSEYSVPVLGLIFLRYADQKFAAAKAELAGKSTGRRQIGPTDYQAKGVLYLPDKAWFVTFPLSERPSMIANRTVFALFIFALLPGLAFATGISRHPWMRRVFLFCLRICSGIPVSIMVGL